MLPTARIENGKLFLKLTDPADTSKFRKGQRVFQGDDWEIFLAADRKGDFFQLLIAPSGKFETFRRQGGKYEDYPVKGITVKSKLDKNLWQAEVTLPLDALPVRKIAAGNFIRGIPDSGIAWCPTFEKSYGIPAVFGNLILEK